MAATEKRARRSFGKIRRSPSSGKWLASYVGPDGQRHNGPRSYDTKGDAAGWLAQVQTDIARDEWHRPEPERQDMPTLDAYAALWLTERDLRPRSRDHYRRLVSGYLSPAFGGMRLDHITPLAVRSWHAGLAAKTGPTRRAHAYGMLRSILNTAIADDIMPGPNPCRVRGAGSARRQREIKPATLAELRVIAEAMPARYRLAVLLAAWCALRFGEIAELRRKDIDARAGMLHIRRALTWVAGEPIVGRPKTDAGIRDVAIPPHLLPLIAAHLAEHTEPGRDSLLFTLPNGGWLRPDAGFRSTYLRARLSAGRPDLRFHDLRHTGATLAAATGASLAELMRRLGHSTPDTAMRYQHAVDDRDRAIAEALSEFHAGSVVELRPRQARRRGKSA